MCGQWGFGNFKHIRLQNILFTGVGKSYKNTD